MIPTQKEIRRHKTRLAFVASANRFGRRKFFQLAWPLSTFGFYLVYIILQIQDPLPHLQRSTDALIFFLCEQAWMLLFAAIAGYFMVRKLWQGFTIDLPKKLAKEAINYPNGL